MCACYLPASNNGGECFLSHSRGGGKARGLCFHAEQKDDLSAETIKGL